MGAETRGGDDIEKNLQKAIPDGWMGRLLLDLDAPLGLTANDRTITRNITANIQQIKTKPNQT